jgi:hypothetical protein
MLPSLGQYNFQEPGRRSSGYGHRLKYWGPEAIQQRQSTLNKKDIDPANVRILPVKEEEVDAIPAIDGMSFGAPRPEYYLEMLDSAIKGAGINTSLVAEALTSISQVDCKG